MLTIRWPQRRVLVRCLGIEPVDDPFAELPCLVEQAQVRRVADRLLGDRGIENQFPLPRRRHSRLDRFFTLHARAGRILILIRCIDSMLGAARTPFALCLLGPHGAKNGLMKRPEHRLAHPLADLHKQRRGKRGLARIARRPREVLQIRVLLDLQHRFLVRQAQLVLDDHRPDDQPSVVGSSALAR